jgi:hypothetical protein
MLATTGLESRITREANILIPNSYHHLLDSYLECFFKFISYGYFILSVLYLNLYIYIDYYIIFVLFFYFFTCLFFIMFFLKKNHIFFLDNLEFQDENINIV